jgi:hypothetical protein
MEPESLLPYSQVPDNCPYPEPAPSSLHNPLPLPEDPSCFTKYNWCIFHIILSACQESRNAIFTCYWMDVIPIIRVYWIFCDVVVQYRILFYRTLLRKTLATLISFREGYRVTRWRGAWGNKVFKLTSRHKFKTLKQYFYFKIITVNISNSQH